MSFPDFTKKVLVLLGKIADFFHKFEIFWKFSQIVFEISKNAAKWVFGCKNRCWYNRERALYRSVKICKNLETSLNCSDVTERTSQRTKIPSSPSRSASRMTQLRREHIGFDAPTGAGQPAEQPAGHCAASGFCFPHVYPGGSIQI